MNEEDRVGKEITKLLDRSVNEIDQHTLHQLQAARKAALDNYQPASKNVYAGRGVSAYSGYDWFLAHTNKVLLSVMVLLILMVGLYREMANEVDTNAATDAVLLADELPIDIYLDDEFDLWLESTR